MSSRFAIPAPISHSSHTRSLLPSQSGSCRIAHPIRSIDSLVPRHSSVTLTDLTVHLARSHGSIVSQVPPAVFDLYPRGFTGHVAHPIRSIVSQVPPAVFDLYLEALPDMSLIPFAPLTRGCASDKTSPWRRTTQRAA